MPADRRTYSTYQRWSDSETAQRCGATLLSRSGFCSRQVIFLPIYKEGNYIQFQDRIAYHRVTVYFCWSTCRSGGVTCIPNCIKLRRQILRNYTIRERGQIKVITGYPGREEKGKRWAPAPSSGWVGGIQRCVALLSRPSSGI